MKVCFLALDTIGDLVLRQPLLRAACDAGHDVMLVVGPDYADLVPILDVRLRWIVSSVSPFRPRGVEVELAALSATLAEVRNFGPDWMVATAYTRTYADEWLLRNAPWTRRAGFTNRDEKTRFEGAVSDLAESVQLALDRTLDRAVAVEESMHESAKALALADALPELGLRNFNPPSLSVGDLARQRAREVLKGLGIEGRFAFVAPAGTANNALKAIPIELARDVTDHLHEAHKLVSVIAGVVSEEAHLRAVAEGKGYARVWVGSPLQLETLVSIVGQATVYVGADTGPMHIASALNVPVVSLFGGGHWPRFVPEGSRSIAVRNPLPCYGCNWICKWKRPICIETIEPSSVTRAVDLVLGTGLIEREMGGASKVSLLNLARVVDAASASIEFQTAPLQKEVSTLHSTLSELDADCRMRGEQIQELTAMVNQGEAHRADLNRQVVELNEIIASNATVQIVRTAMEPQSNRVVDAVGNLGELVQVLEGQFALLQAKLDEVDARNASMAELASTQIREQEQRFLEVRTAIEAKLVDVEAERDAARAHAQAFDVQMLELRRIEDAWASSEAIRQAQEQKLVEATALVEAAQKHGQQIEQVVSQLENALALERRGYARLERESAEESAKSSLERQMAKDQIESMQHRIGRLKEGAEVFSAAVASVLRARRSVFGFTLLDSKGRQTIEAASKHSAIVDE